MNIKWPPQHVSPPARGQDSPITNYVVFRDGGKTSEQGLYEALSQLIVQGMPTNNTASSLQAVQRGAGANMSVDISIGACMMPNPAGTYSYIGYTDAVVNQTISAADPTNPRIDIIVAYVDLSVVSSSSNNNPGALKFADVTGTPAGSPSAPNSSAIQSAIGAGNPWTYVAQIAVAANATQIVTANITDKRFPWAVRANVWGGASNTNGHTVPNTADDTVALLAAVQSFTNKSFDSTNTLTAPKFRSIDGWVDANESWTYASATTITVPSDATTKYDVGDFIKLTQSATVKYFIVTAVSATVLTVAGIAGATVANSPISTNYYSKARTPHGAGTSGLPFNPYKFSVYRSSAWSASSTPAAILFDTTVFDTSSNYAAATGKFTAPVAGFYQFSASAGCAQSAANAAGSLVFYKNGVAIAGGNGELGAASSWGIQSTGSCLLQLAANDYVQVFFSSQSAIAGNFGQTVTYFMGFLVSTI